MSDEWADLCAENESLRAELHDCRDAMARLKSGADTLRAQLAIEKDRVIKQTLHAAELRAERDSLKADRHNLTIACANMDKANDALRSRIAELEGALQQLVHVAEVGLPRDGFIGGVIDKAREALRGGK